MPTLVKQKPVKVLSVVDESLWSEINHTDQFFHTNKGLHDVFVETATMYPEHIAVSDGQDRTITFKALDEKSNMVANYLISQGIRIGDYISVFMDRSIEAIIAMLGVMKAGAVYVPLTPENPEERNQYIIKDSTSKLVLTSKEHKDILAHLMIESAVPYISIEDISEENTTPAVIVENHDLAYIIYTSGSTGTPKGVKIRHESIVNFGYALKSEFSISPSDVLAQFFMLSFDASFIEVCTMIYSGARLHFLTKEERVDVTAFAETVQKYGITHVMAFPVSALKQFSIYANEDDAKKTHTLKMIGVGGEALTGEVVRLFHNKFKHVQLVNLYGPTEATAAASYYRVDGEKDSKVENVPIGKPFSNYKFYVVNDDLELNPVGVEGELLIDSISVSEGYLNLPDKTEKVFVKVPYSDRVVYRTGDRAKLLPSGHIEYLGRVDLQVKIRGYRIELGEIENRMFRADFIEEGAVVPKEVNGDKVLVAYYSIKEGHRATKKQVIEIISDGLPSYMIPTYFIELPMIPLSPTLKVNRNQLIALPLENSASFDEEKKQPSNHVEVNLLKVWQEVLGIMNIGVDENFFELGGHSLKVLGALTLLKKDYKSLKINDFFTNPTIESLSQYILTNQTNETNENESLQFHEKIKLIEHPITLSTNKQVQLKEQTTTLLTGATGYLGSHILLDLLNASAHVIYVLVRAANEEEGWSKVQSALNYYASPGSLDDEDIHERIKILVGDFSKENLGLHVTDYDKLDLIDSIIHCGADVRHFGSEESFTMSNVVGTENLLQIAKDQGCRFHYVSTIGIPEELALEGYWDKFLTSENISDAPDLPNLYTNSKLKSEKLVEKYYQEGIPVTIYRPGNVTCHFESGKFQTNINSNAVYRMIKSFILLGKAPKVEANMDFAMVNIASKSIVALALDDQSVGGVFHICNPHNVSFADMLNSIKSFGYPIELVDLNVYEDWLYNDNPKNQEGLELAMAGLEGDGAKNSPLVYACPATTNTLNEKGINFPIPDEDFIHRMLTHAIEVGFLPTPKEME
ncbi:amino acid adenylation domain-containing protein/thioester reductase-like protein [Metabacillus crassostreae]|uniref:non-ribosomal peptide synthetase n=1 Tax=Metabacillus crassostreae TaxID=929098 RepID=UPI001957DF99|nr:non-ribosomal peptide synthetase [Metabacillus crassostreae]MBM7604832.1 amino acid adenylation domain-containing protein/thioester reductase-like protein [Metabacillus crassostreae]